MADPDKTRSIEDYFESMQGRFDSLAQLNAGLLNGHSFRDEAIILCLVYIDGLASSYYGRGKGNGGKNFCKALRKLSATHFLGSSMLPGF